jgi:hypothetical protein
VAVAPIAPRLCSFSSRPLLLLSPPERGSRRWPWLEEEILDLLGRLGARRAGCAGAGFGRLRSALLLITVGWG